MSWTRLDDRWTELPVFDGMPHAVRWHYLCLIQLCSRTDRLDGRLSRPAALRASDVDDPARAMADLAAADLVTLEPGGYVLVRIAEHVPPPSVRKASEAGKERMRRSRAHKAGDHSLCLADNCPDAGAVARSVTRNSPEAQRVAPAVTRNTGTGRDRTGRAVSGGATEAIDRTTGEVTEWPDSLPHCEVCGGPMPADLAASEGWTSHPACDRAVVHDGREMAGVVHANPNP